MKLTYGKLLRSKQGFTLIELMMIIAVIALLTSLAALNFRSAQNRAHDTNVKTSVHNYGSALELYNAQRNTYLVYDHQSTCKFSSPNPAITIDPTDTTHTYLLYGDTAAVNGCSGYYGSGEGRMTRRNIITATIPSIPHYMAKSIADSLVAEGTLSEIHTFPDSDAKDFSKDTANDFYLTVCDGNGQEAVSEKTAVNYAIFAKTVIKPQVTDQQKAGHLCGGDGDPYGWKWDQDR